MWSYTVRLQAVAKSMASEFREVLDCGDGSVVGHLADGLGHDLFRSVNCLRGLPLP